MPTITTQPTAVTAKPVPVYIAWSSLRQDYSKRRGGKEKPSAAHIRATVEGFADTLCGRQAQLSVRELTPEEVSSTVLCHRCQLLWKSQHD